MRNKSNLLRTIEKHLACVNNELRRFSGESAPACFDTEKLSLYLSNMKSAPVMIVGASAPKKSRQGETPSGKNFERIVWPAGLGALAITVSPPPTTAPAITAYFICSVKFGTRDAK